MNDQRKPSNRLRGPAARGSCIVKSIIVVLLLTLGFLIGAGVAAWTVKTQVLKTMSEPERVPDIVTSGMASDLGLSPQQTERVRAILHKRYDQLVWMTYEMWPIIDATIERTADDIRGVLDEAQTEQFNERYRAIRANVLKRPEKPERSPGGMFDLIPAPSGDSPE